MSDPSAFIEALDHCGSPGTITAEIGLSGRAAGQRLRGTLHAGFAPPQSLRLEAVAPFGGPFFILAGTGGRATLLLPRDNRVLRDANSGEILEALAGLDQTPGDLRAWIEGCPAGQGQVRDPRAYGTDWAAADFDEGRQVWLSRVPTAGAAHGRAWRMVAVKSAALAIEFADHHGVQPGRLRITRAEASGVPALDIRLALQQVERGVQLGAAAFAVDVPPDAAPITIEELKQSGPLRDKRP